jgi:GNAT superfamily N-acetyltransferase
VPAKDLRPIKLTPDHIAGALALSAEAGWNQVEADWRFMLGSGQGFGFLDPAGTLVASGLTVEFSRYAWISMILVTPRRRRQGLATRLMESCVGTLLERGLIPALDASPDGREVYRRLGFRDAGTTTRLAGDLSGAAAPPAEGIMPVSESDLPEIVAYDERSSGTDRSALLRHLWERLPTAAFVARRNSRVSGYVLARNGRMSAQIGPLVAGDEALATALLDRAGRAIGGRFCLDVFDQRTELRNWLDHAGFQPLTRFIRMIYGSAGLFPPGHKVHAIAGPELS